MGEVDFVCLEKGLIIEIDGFQHGFEENVKRDQKRDAWLASEGFVTLRFANRDINHNLDGVLNPDSEVESALVANPFFIRDSSLRVRYVHNDM